MEPLLVFAPYEPFLPTVRELVDRGTQGSQWNRICSHLTVALLQFRAGRFLEAQGAIEKYLNEGAVIFKTGMDPYWSRGWFLRSAIEAKLQNLTAARNSYSEGLKKYSSVLQSPDGSYAGDEWGTACAAELLRREAAALLGNATPTAP